MGNGIRFIARFIVNFSVKNMSNIIKSINIDYPFGKGLGCSLQEEIGQGWQQIKTANNNTPKQHYHNVITLANEQTATIPVFYFFRL